MSSQRPEAKARALIQHNLVYGNGKSGISVSDSAFGTVDSNVLAKNVDGTISHNAGSVGIELHSSGDPTRGVQHDAVVSNNAMSGETIKGTGTDRDGTPNTGCTDNNNVCSNNN